MDAVWNTGKKKEINEKEKGYNLYTASMEQPNLSWTLQLNIRTCSVITNLLNKKNFA